VEKINEIKADLDQFPDEKPVTFKKVRRISQIEEDLIDQKMIKFKVEKP
jgi:hypothetical protein